MIECYNFVKVNNASHNNLIFQKCIQTSISGIDKTSAFPIIQGEFDRSKGDVDSKRIFLDQSFRDCVTSDSKLDMDKYSDLVQLSIKGISLFKSVTQYIWKRIDPDPSL